MRTKYLAGHAEPEAALAGAIEGAWDHVVVMPACDEDAAALVGLVRASRGRRVLAVVVVNARTDHDASVHARNAALLAAGTEGAREPAPGVWFRAGEPDLVLVDRASPGRRFGVRDGVGLARKIGSDLALALADRIASPWIHFTDADAVLPASHFEVAAPRGTSALVRNFEHVASGDVQVDDAHRRYELALRYYVEGLRWAGSPYAFHTIGSIMGVDRDAYAGVRGVPRRQAGEDFYLLNKLAKLGPVVRVPGEPVQIRSRTSARVPFGTGPAVSRLMQDPQGPRIYAPESFRALRAWLAVLGRAEAGEWDERDLDELAPGLRERLEDALERVGAREPLQRLHARHHGSTRARQLRTWFDGFRTLKLIHALRDAGLADRPWREAFAGAPFLAGIDPDADVERVRATLAARDLAP